MVFPKYDKVGSGSPDLVLRFLRLVAGSNFIRTGGDLGTAAVEAGVTMPLPIILRELEGGGPGGGGYIP